MDNLSGPEKFIRDWTYDLYKYKGHWARSGGDLEEICKSIVNDFNVMCLEMSRQVRDEMEMKYKDYE